MTGWSVLPAYLVRLAGFAFDRLDRVRCSRAAAAEAALEAAMTERRAAGRAFDEAVAKERYADHPAFDDPAVRKAMSKNVKHARAFARELVEAMPAAALAEVVRVMPRVAPLAAELERTHARWLEARRAFAAVFAEDFAAARTALRAVYRDDPRLQEAVFLESADAHERVQQLVASDGARNSRARQRERLAAMYLQRFCAKNDTNSFCGPHGIGWVTDADRSERAHVEVTLEDARRQTYFSHWAAQEVLAAAVARAGEGAVTYRMQPSARLDGNAVTWCVMDHDATTSFRRRYMRSELPPVGLRLLEQLRRRALVIADLDELAVDLEIDRDELRGFVDELVERGIVLKGPVLAPGLFRPLRTVDALVSWWEDDSEARKWALAEVAAFEDLVAAFARAPFAERPALAARLAARFSEVTGGEAQRGAGRHYADRSLLHEDCAVDVRVDLGPTVRAALDRTLPALVSALELPLELARERVREWFRNKFGARTRVPALTAHRAFDEDRPLDTPAATPRAEQLRVAIERVRAMIARAADAAAGAPVKIGSRELLEAIGERVAPPRAGYLSADLMLRAGGEHTEIVLGEVHGFFWLPTSLLDVFVDEQHAPVVHAMREAVVAMAAGKPTAECVFLHTQATDRRFSIATTDLQLMTRTGREYAVDLGALDVELVGDTFVYRIGESEIVPLVAYTSYPFMLYTSRIAPLFDDFAERFFPDSLMPDSLRDRDAPRLVLDQVVFRRRLWRRSAGELRAVLAATDEAELFAAGQRLRRALGCGERVFVSIPGEPKPVLLDFYDMFLVEAVANLIAGKPDDAAIKITEMLPAPEELATKAPDGLRTSELRMGFYRTL